MLEVDPERQHHNVTLAILTLAGAAFSLQQTMVFPALRTFQEEFGSTTAWTTWVLTGFLVSGAVLTPILGRLGDQFGKERLLLVSLGLFLAGCLGAAFAWNLWSLIAFRVVSGAGGALFPLSFAIIRDEFPPEKVKVGIGLLSAVWGVGGGFGIVLSGLIVDNFSWRYLFLLGSIPVALSLVLVHRYVPESPIRSPSKVDVPGALLLSGGLISLMVALTEGEHWGWGSPLLLGVLALAAVLFLLWGFVESRSSSPMVDLRMLAHRPILLTNIATLISGFALFSCFVLVPTFVETDSANGYGFSASATQAGLYLLPSSLAMLFAGPLAGAVGRRYGSKWPLAIGMLIVSVAAFLFATPARRAGHGPARERPARARRRRRLRSDGGADRGQRRSARDGRRGRDEHRRTDDRRRHRRPGRGGAAHRPHDRRLLGSGRVGVHDHVRAQRRHRADRRRDRGLDRLPPGAAAAGNSRAAGAGVVRPDERRSSSRLTRVHSTGRCADPSRNAA